MSKERTLHNTLRSGWWFILHPRIIEMKEKEETKDWYEFAHLRICEKWLQIESCRKCLFEVLCDYEKMILKNKVNQ